MDKIKEKSVKNITKNYYSNDKDEDDKFISFIGIADLYDQQYNFDNDENILDSFSKIYKNMI